MVITLISSLTPDDENVCATALLQHFVSVLRQLPIAYAIRIETADQVFQHSAADGAVVVSAEPVPRPLAQLTPARPLGVTPIPLPN